ncbi:MAG: hypothetical protein KIH62_002210 [Candidatus Kerfeldbacteria bacterium]|nr:hypothetical protein [Candidatus Kerfeldbacteria bacterium]
MKDLIDKFYWQVNTSSGGTLSIRLTLEEDLSRAKKESALAQALSDCVKQMDKNGYIPAKARALSSRDIAHRFGYTRQYWEKLLNQGKIPYHETSAGKITTDLWVRGYLDDKENVDQYVRNVRKVLQFIKTKGKKSGVVSCPDCLEERFEFYVNFDTNVNGICRACNFQINTITDQK